MFLYALFKFNEKPADIIDNSCVSQEHWVLWPKRVNIKLQVPYKVFFCVAIIGMWFEHQNLSRVGSNLYAAASVLIIPFYLVHSILSEFNKFMSM